MDTEVQRGASPCLRSHRRNGVVEMRPCLTQGHCLAGGASHLARSQSPEEGPSSEQEEERVATAGAVERETKSTLTHLGEESQASGVDQEELNYNSRRPW